MPAAIDHSSLIKKIVSQIHPDQWKSMSIKDRQTYIKYQMKSQGKFVADNHLNHRYFDLWRSDVPLQSNRNHFKKDELKNLIIEAVKNYSGNWQELKPMERVEYLTNIVLEKRGGTEYEPNNFYRHKDLWLPEDDPKRCSNFQEVEEFIKKVIDELPLDQWRRMKSKARQKYINQKSQEIRGKNLIGSQIYRHISVWHPDYDEIE